jgi:hypothetical protein
MMRGCGSGLALLAVIVTFGFARLGLAQGEAPAKPAKPAAKDQATLEKEFSERLSGAVFVGRFTVDGSKKDPQPEKYTIQSVRKLVGETWLFTARIEYGGKDITVPMPLTVKWAGDTPVITLTDLSIPPLGTFTSRVLIHGDRYAGTWQHDKVGGLLFGTIEKPKPADKPEAAPKANTPAEKSPGR